MRRIWGLPLEEDDSGLTQSPIKLATQGICVPEPTLFASGAVCNICLVVGLEEVRHSQPGTSPLSLARASHLSGEFADVVNKVKRVAALVRLKPLVRVRRVAPANHTPSISAVYKVSCNFPAKSNFAGWDFWRAIWSFFLA